MSIYIDFDKLSEPLIQDLREIAESVQSEEPLCMSVHDVEAAQIKPFFAALNQDTIIVDPDGAQRLLALVDNAKFGRKYVTDHLKYLIRRARIYNTGDVFA
jgi:hypothetical protein